LLYNKLNNLGHAQPSNIHLQNSEFEYKIILPKTCTLTDEYNFDFKPSNNTGSRRDVLLKLFRQLKNELVR
jgi:hypothetical protein